jgi:hypothetical protein
MKLFEIYNGLFESKKTEIEGLNILNRNGVENGESIIQQMAKMDKSNNQKNIPIMAYIYANGYTDLNNITSIMDEYNALEIKQRIKPAQLTKTGIVIGDRQFTDFIKFSEFIHGETNKYAEKPKGGSGVDSGFKAEKKPIWSGNGIDIYNGDNVGKCINYTQGGLTGKAYGFCIGQPGNTMYKSYRDSKISTFYFIIDKNHFSTNDDGRVNLDDPLHIVVFDNTANGVELTDANNSTGTISMYGDDVEAYIGYLKSQGVPVEKMMNNPKTPQEDEEERLLGQPNDSLEWFMKLPIEYKSAYIGRGHRLTNDQFDYLIGR